jgi:thioredoxin reductase
MVQQLYDVLIIGGSYAGLQGALTLARSLRKVLIVDSGEPCNRYAVHSHNFLTQDGTEIEQLAHIAKQQVLAYPTVSFKEAKIQSVQKEDNVFIAVDTAGTIYRSRKLLLATGLTDIMPDIKGFRECWGKSIVHCPYCHGYELRGKKLGLMTFGAAAKDFLPLVYHLSTDLTLFMDENPSEETAKFLQRTEACLIRSDISEVLHDNGSLYAVITRDGERYALDALFVSLRSEQNLDIAKQLDCCVDDKGFIESDIVCKTNIEGVYAAGDCTTAMRSLPAAVAAGYKAGIGIHYELLEDALREKLKIKTK